LWQYSGSHEEEFEDFLRYKQRVPVLGGILLDKTWEQVVYIRDPTDFSVSLSKLGKDRLGHFQGGKLTRMNLI
jgi:hypothetical protein